jgi:hypothetical protein
LYFQVCRRDVETPVVNGRTAQRSDAAQDVGKTMPADPSTRHYTGHNSPTSVFHEYSLQPVLEVPSETEDESQNIMAETARNDEESPSLLGFSHSAAVMPLVKSAQSLELTSEIPIFGGAKRGSKTRAIVSGRDLRAVHDSKPRLVL